MWLTILACLAIGGLFVWARPTVDDDHPPFQHSLPIPDSNEESCPSVNVDGTPMLNCHIDIHGKPYGVPSQDDIDTPWSPSKPSSWDTSFDWHSPISSDWD